MKKLIQNKEINNKLIGDNLRQWTYKNLFGKDAANRNRAQAAERDETHAAFHAGKAFVETVKGNKEQASKDWFRAKDHASGENYHQRQRSKSK